MACDLQKRLMLDIAEMKKKPYPNIRLHVDDQNINEVCLVLTPEGWKTLHLTVTFPPDYPLKAPTVRMDSNVAHPNVFGGYICASILNTTEGYTPAYTLKGITIQLLSFFCSDSVEQIYDGHKVSLQEYREKSNLLSGSGNQYFYAGDDATTFGRDNICTRCGHNRGWSDAPKSSSRAGSGSNTSRSSRPRRRKAASTAPSTATEISRERFFIDRLPSEIILQIAEGLEFEDLTKFASAWDRVSSLITEFDVVRTRELQCFVLKENYMTRKLGVGVDVVGNGRQGTLQSEFDLLSHAAYTNHRISQSIHNIPFRHWLPLPISFGHWQRVKSDADTWLARIADDARISSTTLVLYAFMNDVIVRLNSDLERQHNPQDRHDAHAQKSTLRHASEKAIESYFHLFHLLLCIATAKPSVVTEANRMIASFMAGKTNKTDVPNLGYLLIALLISDTDPTETLMKEIITEAITRNVVWLLDQKGAGMAELGYLESDEVCNYRLKKTFEGSRTSYRLLMFSELFRRTARPSPPKGIAPAPTPPIQTPATTLHAPSYTAAASTPNSQPPIPARRPGKKTLPQLRDELFRRHGGPLPGAAAHLAAEVRRLQKIDDFPSFLREMGVAIPPASKFTTVLRGTVKLSAEKGYSRPVDSHVRWTAAMRIARDPSINRTAVEADIAARGLSIPGTELAMREFGSGRIKFFPGPGTGAGAARGQANTGRGRGGGGRGGRR